MNQNKLHGTSYLNVVTQLFVDTHMLIVWKTLVDVAYGEAKNSIFSQISSF